MEKITAQELRLGNFVHDKDGILIIVDSIVTAEGIGINAPVSYKGCCPDYYLSDISPIPITEQWLLDLGFVADRRKYSVELLNTVTFLGYGIRLHPIVNGKRYRTEFQSENISDINIDYVHTLQNLIFSLTGKELEYNPKKEAGEQAK